MSLLPAEPLSLLAQPDAAEVRVATLVVLLVVAAVIDVRTLRIPNWLTVSGALMGLALSAAVPWQTLGPAWAVDGFLWSLGGLAAGLALMLPFWLLRVMGAGDVKLMAMAGAFVGLAQIVPVVLCVFVAGGVLAVGWALYRRVFRRAASNAAEITIAMAVAALNGMRPALPAASAGKLPYGVSIAAGTLAWLVLASSPH